MIRQHGLSETWEELARGIERDFSHPAARPAGHDAGAGGAARRPGEGRHSQGHCHQQRTEAGRRVPGAVGPGAAVPFILTAEDMSHGKPNPEIYLTAARRLDVPPERMLVLEDSENGCRAAAAAGAFAVAVPGDHSRRHDFSFAALVIDSLADPRLYAALGLQLLALLSRLWHGRHSRGGTTHAGHASSS